MAEINSLYFKDSSRQLIIDNDTNQFIISGYRVVVDPSLNRDLLIVGAPSSTGDRGQKGNIAFDGSHLYYCIETNKWVRTKMAYWGARDGSYGGGSTNDGIINPITVTVDVPTPTNWWPFTSNANATLGSYQFQAVPICTFNSDGFSNDNGYGHLLNYTSNLVEPSILNQDFSISFEIKRRTAGGFIMGQPFGNLGFYFSFINGNKDNRGGFNQDGTKIGFTMNCHLGTLWQYPAYDAYRWRGVCSIDPISMSVHSQIIGVNEAAAKTIKLYVNGALQGSISYADAPLGSRWTTPSFQGWGIAASPNGSAFGHGANSVEYFSTQTLRQMGFWKGYALSQTDVTKLYNGGDFKRYPFV
jgi:hypothetical protein